MDHLLNDLVEKLKSAAGHNLQSVVLYGAPAVDGVVPARHGDLNVLCVLERAGAAELAALSPAVVWWVHHGAPAPQIFTLPELERSADVFAIELLDMKRHHRILFGNDFLSGLHVPMHLHRLQVERDLRTNWLRLRQGVLLARGNEKVLADLMTASVLRFALLFRHALMALGETPPDGRDEVIHRIADIAGAPAAKFSAVLALRAEKSTRGSLDVPATLAGYLSFIERVTDEVDRRLESQSPAA